MAMQAAAAKAAPVQAPAAAPKKSKFVLLSLLVVLLVMVGAGAAWWMLHEPADEDEESLIDSRPPIFLPLEQFTVNLQPEEGNQQFLQMAVTLKLAEHEIAEDIKARMPQVRSRVLLLLSSKKPSELSPLEGKNQLTQELIREIESSLPAVKAKAKKARKKARDEEDDGKQAKKKGKAKASARDEAEEEEPAPQRVLAVYFTHFIVQ